MLCLDSLINSFSGCQGSVFVSRLPNHAQHVNTHLITSQWVFNVMESHWTWAGPTSAAQHPSAGMTEREKRDGKPKNENSWRKRLTFTEARMQLNFCWCILCILLPEAKKKSMAGCSAKRGSRKRTCVYWVEQQPQAWPSGPCFFA